MAKRHSKETRVYVYTSDISGQSSSIVPSLANVTPETTNFESEGREHNTELTEDSLDWEGFFEDLDGTGEESLGSILADLRSVSTERYVSLWPGGDVYGRPGYGGITSPGQTLSYTSRIAEMVVGRHNFRFQGHPADRMLSLLPKAERSASPSSSAGLDNGAATTNGLVWGYHVFDIESGAAWRIDLQHSSNGSTWTTLDSVVASTRDAARRVIAGSVPQHLRARLTRTTGTGAATIHTAVSRK